MLLLDLGLPRKAGLDVLGALRARGDSRPVLILTARDAVADRVAGLDAGADDYMVKPFDLDELAARVRALARRRGGRSAPTLEHGSIVLDPAARSATLDGRPLALSPREFALLEALMLRPSAVLSRAQLEERLYGWNEAVESNAVEVHLHGLRRKLACRRDPQRARRGLDAGGGEGHKRVTVDPAHAHLWLTSGLALALVAAARAHVSAGTRRGQRALRLPSPADGGLAHGPADRGHSPPAPASATRASSCRSGTRRRARLPLATRGTRTRPDAQRGESGLRDDRHAVGTLSRVQRAGRRAAGAGRTAAGRPRGARGEARGLDGAAAGRPDSAHRHCSSAVAIHRALAPLARVAKAVQHRSPAQLAPIASAGLAAGNRAAGRCAQRLARPARRARSTPSARSSPTRRTSCARRWQRWGCRRSSRSAPRIRPTRAQALGELRGGLARATRMVEQLLALAREEPGVAERPFVPVALATLARDASPPCRRWPRRSRSTSASSAPTPSTVAGDADALAHAAREPRRQRDPLHALRRSRGRPGAGGADAVPRRARRRSRRSRERARAALRALRARRRRERARAADWGLRS